MLTCLNLRDLYGGEYRVTCDPSCEHHHHNHTCDSWNAVIPCQHGHVYPHGGNQLGVSTNRRGHTSRAIAALPFVRVTQDGNDGINAVFAASHFKAVAAIVKPKRRRRLTAEHKVRLAASNAKHRFVSASNRSQKAVPGVPTSKPVSEAIQASHAVGHPQKPRLLRRAK